MLKSAYRKFLACRWPDVGAFGGRFERYAQQGVPTVITLLTINNYNAFSTIEKKEKIDYDKRRRYTYAAQKRRGGRTGLKKK